MVLTKQKDEYQVKDTFFINGVKYELWLTT
jgi:hypothetical protein